MPNELKTRSIWRREISAWCCYDWANSGYTTLMVTLFAVYIQRIVFPAEPANSSGAIVWAWTVAISMLAGAILSPILGSLADAKGGKRLGLGLSAFGGSIACMTMAILPPEQFALVTLMFFLANLCLELSLTFYNGFLPEIATDKEMNRVSAAGVSWGYLGGGIALLLAMLTLDHWSALDPDDNSRILRICIFSTGVWWALFTLPTISVLRDKPTPKISVGLLESGKRAILDVVDTLKNVRRYRTLAMFLLAFLFFNDGLQTVISQSSTFALQELRFTDRELVAVVLMVQFVATPGAILVGWAADKLGQKQTLVMCLLAWVVLLGSAWFINTKIAYWFMAFGVAFVLGGTQSVSRAIMGVFTPQRHAARFFGFFNLSGKATSFMGTFLFGLTIAVTGSSRWAIVNLIIFFVIGLWLLTRIDIQTGVQEREELEDSASVAT